MTVANSDKKDTDPIKRLNDLREKLGWSQRKMAKELGVAPGSISLWETGKRSIPGPVLKLLDLYEQRLKYGETEKLKAIESGSWERVFQNSLFLGKVGVDWAKVNLHSLVVSREKSLELKKQTTNAIALEFLKHMSQLRGIHMKIGQMFGFMGPSLSPHVKSFVEQYQYNFKIMAGKIIEESILKGLGKTPSEIFKEWDPLPFAGGSIGQVHRVVTKEGQVLALKVQYPEIVNALKSDLKHLQVLSKFLGLYLSSENRTAFLQEMEERFLEETDYELERRYLEKFQEVWKDHPYIRIPKCYSEYSSKTTLAMEYIEGQDFYEFCKTASEEERSIAATSLFSFYFDSFYKSNLLHCDPHPANYKFHDGKIYILDFGCSRVFNKKSTQGIRGLWIPAIEQDFEAFKRATDLAGFVAVPEKFLYREFYNQIRLLLEPVIYSEDGFRFNHHYVANIYRAFFSESQNMQNASVKKEYIFLQRLQFGLYTILANLDVKADWRSLYFSAIDYEGKDKDLILS